MASFQLSEPQAKKKYAHIYIYIYNHIYIYILCMHKSIGLFAFSLLFTVSFCYACKELLLLKGAYCSKGLCCRGSKQLRVVFPYNLYRISPKTLNPQPSTLNPKP